MITLLLLLVLLITVPVAAGFIKSRAQRRIDRPHFAAFVGLSAGAAACVATVIYLAASVVWFRAPESQYDHPSRGGFLFICGSLGLISSAIAFFAGLFSRGIWRVALVILGLTMGLIYVFAAFSNFGA
jgi:hypothetical protein